MALTEAEKKEFSRLEKKLNHYATTILVTFEQSLTAAIADSKEAALDDFFQKQFDYRPTEEEIEQLKALAHKEPEMAQTLLYDLNSLDERESQILNRLRP